MNYLFILAVKNILRAKRRTVLTFLILSFGVAFYILMTCVLEGFDRSSIQNLIEFETGHFKVYHAQFDEDRPYELDTFISGAPALEGQLRRLPFVTGVTARVSFLTEIDNGRDALPVVAVGIDPLHDTEVFSLANFMDAGELKAEGMLVGKDLAQDLGLGINDTAYLTFRDQQGMFTSIEMLVTGIVNAPDPAVNRATVFLRLPEAQKALNTDQVSEIAVKTRDWRKIREFTPAIKAMAKAAGVKVRNWKELTADVSALAQTKKKVGSVFLFFIILVAVVGIVNTMLMSVYEKRPEIGTFKALGMTDGEVSRMFLLEGLLIGVAGGVLGLVLGTLFNLYFATVGIDITAMMGSQNNQNIGFQVMGLVKSIWVPGAYFRAMLMALVASALASYYPARKVAKMQPMECLRTVQ